MLPSPNSVDLQLPEAKPFAGIYSSLNEVSCHKSNMGPFGSSAHEGMFALSTEDDKSI